LVRGWLLGNTEDQALISLSLEAYVEETGFGGCETFPSDAGALGWLATNTPTVAILDYSLKDGPCTSLVRALQECGVPFVIYSGHRRTVARRQRFDFRALRSGRGYIEQKPFMDHLLLHARATRLQCLLSWT
jgi:DNA-binding response OmpR family regulator